MRHTKNWRFVGRNWEKKHKGRFRELFTNCYAFFGHFMAAAGNQPGQQNRSYFIQLKKEV